MSHHHCSHGHSHAHSHDSENRQPLWAYVTRITISIIIVAILMTKGMTFQVNGGGETAVSETVVVTRFDKPIRVEDKPGLHWKLPWPIDRANVVDMRKRSFSTPHTAALTQDKQSIILLTYVVWRVSDAEQFLKSTKTVEEAEYKLESSVVSEKNTLLGRYNLSTLVSTNPDHDQVVNRLEGQILDAVKGKHLAAGIEVLQVGIKRISFHETTMEATLEKMREERRAAATTIRTKGEKEASEIQNEAKKSSARTRAAGVQEAGIIRADALARVSEIYDKSHNLDPGFYQFWRQMEVIKKTIGVRTTLILQNDSGLFTPIFEMPRMDAAPRVDAVPRTDAPAVLPEIPLTGIKLETPNTGEVKIEVKIPENIFFPEVILPRQNPELPAINKVEENAEAKAENNGEVKVKEEAENDAEEKTEVEVENHGEVKMEEEAENNADEKTEAEVENHGEMKAEEETESDTDEKTEAEVENHEEVKAEEEAENDTDEKTDVKVENDVEEEAENSTEVKTENDVEAEAEAVENTAETVSAEPADETEKPETAPAPTDTSFTRESETPAAEIETPEEMEASASVPAEIEAETEAVVQADEIKMSEIETPAEKPETPAVKSEIPSAEKKPAASVPTTGTSSHSLNSEIKMPDTVPGFAEIPPELKEILPVDEEPETSSPARTVSPADGSPSAEITPSVAKTSAPSRTEASDARNPLRGNGIFRGITRAPSRTY